MSSAVRRLELQHPRGTTPIAIGAGAFDAMQSELANWLLGKRAFVITSPRILALHGEVLARWAPLTSNGFEVFEVPDGESAKTLAVAGDLWSRLLASGGKRDSRILAFGGGSVGDLAGFVAGGFLRGVEFAQVPTTLLAQVDAAIGGKTGVDLPLGKNTVGLFHHPRFVIADASVLTTLSRAELREGLVEAIKMAALLDIELLATIERDLSKLLDGDSETLGPVAAAAAAAKVAVVERDPEEAGERRLLNFGHTLGHALEAAGGYGTLRHGEAVAYGLLFALRLARRRGLAIEESERIRALLARLDLPPLPLDDEAFRPEALLALLARDKKATEEGLAWVLAERLGQGRIERVSPAEIAVELPRFLAAPWG